VPDRPSLSFRRARGVAGQSPLGVAPRHHGAGYVIDQRHMGTPIDWRSMGGETAPISGAG